MIKPLHVFAVLAPILTIGSWFWMDATLDPPQPLSLGFKVGLSLLFGLVPAALTALFWTDARVAALAALRFASPEPGQKLLRA